MNTRLIRIALVLLAAITIVIILLLKLNSSKELSTNDNKSSTVVSTTESNHYSDLGVKQKTEEKDTQQKTLDRNHISECDNPANPNDLISNKYFDEKMTELTNNTEKLSQVLEQLETMESQVAHALITGSEDEKSMSDKFKALNNQYPENKLLSYDLLSSCLLADSLCERSVIDNGLALDNQNGAVWFLSALYELHNNNIEQAKEALLEASSAPTYDEYWGEHFSLFELALSQTGAGNELPAQIASLNYVGSIPLPSFGVLVDFCKNTDLTRADLLDACLRMGVRLTNAKGTMISHLIGLALQKDVFKKYNDDAQVSRISNEKKGFDRTMSLSLKANNLVWQSSQRTSEWIQQIKDFGDVRASEYIVDEAIRLSSDPNFDPCEVNW